jgi:hypothetical protein
LGISFSEHGTLGHSVTGQQGSAGKTDLSNKFATVGHGMFPELLITGTLHESAQLVTPGIVIHSFGLIKTRHPIPG